MKYFIILLIFYLPRLAAQFPPTNLTIGNLSKDARALYDLFINPNCPYSRQQMLHVFENLNHYNFEFNFKARNSNGQNAFEELLNNKEVADILKNDVLGRREGIVLLDQEVNGEKGIFTNLNEEFSDQLKKLRDINPRNIKKERPLTQLEKDLFVKQQMLGKYGKFYGGNYDKILKYKSTNNHIAHYYKLMSQKAELQTIFAPNAMSFSEQLKDWMKNFYTYRYRTILEQRNEALNIVADHFLPIIPEELQIIRVEYLPLSEESISLRQDGTAWSTKSKTKDIPLKALSGEIIDEYLGTILLKDGESYKKISNGQISRLTKIILRKVTDYASWPKDKKLALERLLFIEKSLMAHQYGYPIDLHAEFKEIPILSNSDVARGEQIKGNLSKKLSAQQVVMESKDISLGAWSDYGITKIDLYHAKGLQCEVDNSLPIIDLIEVIKIKIGERSYANQNLPKWFKYTPPKNGSKGSSTNAALRNGLISDKPFIHNKDKPPKELLFRITDHTNTIDFIKIPSSEFHYVNQYQLPSNSSLKPNVIIKTESLSAIDGLLGIPMPPGFEPSKISIIALDENNKKTVFTNYKILHYEDNIVLKLGEKGSEIPKATNLWNFLKVKNSKSTYILDVEYVESLKFYDEAIEKSEKYQHIPKYKVDALSNELRKAKFDKLADELDKLMISQKQFSINDLQNFYKNAALYSYYPAAAETNSNAVSIFQKYLPFLNENKILCFQCDGAASILSDSVNFLEIDGVSARFVSGFSVSGSYVTADLAHAKTEINIGGKYMLQDATPFMEDPRNILIWFQRRFGINSKENAIELLDKKTKELVIQLKSERAKLLEYFETKKINLNAVFGNSFADPITQYLYSISLYTDYLEKKIDYPAFQKLWEKNLLNSTFKGLSSDAIHYAILDYWKNELGYLSEENLIKYKAKRMNVPSYFNDQGVMNFIRTNMKEMENLGSTFTYETLSPILQYLKNCLK